MKKVLKYLLFILMISSALNVFATVKGAAKRGMPITAQKGVVQDVSITPITSLNENAFEGIPFYLTDDNVKYSDAKNAVVGKRQIATWSLYSNSPKPHVIIDAPHLTHADGSKIPYQLAFYYQFKNGASYVGGNLIVHSGTPYDSSQDPDCLWNQYDLSVAFTNRPVRFMLGVEDIENSEYPYGDYKATVTITIEADK